MADVAANRKRVPCVDADYNTQQLEQLDETVLCDSGLHCDVYQSNKRMKYQAESPNSEQLTHGETPVSKQVVDSHKMKQLATGKATPISGYRGCVDDRPGASLPITPENYQCEEERMRSFIGWPLNEAVHPEQLARIGFVYTGDGALVQCFQCGIKYRHWYKGDLPLNVHQKCNPRCAFLQTLGSESKATTSERRPTKSYIQPESIPSNMTKEVSKRCLQFPDYSDEATRLESFKYWGGVVPVQELAEAGFYMIARRDVVRHNSKCDFVKTFLSNTRCSNNVVFPSTVLSGYPNFATLPHSSTSPSSKGLGVYSRSGSLPCERLRFEPVMEDSSTTSIEGLPSQMEPQIQPTSFPNLEMHQRPAETADLSPSPTGHWESSEQSGESLHGHRKNDVGRNMNTGSISSLDDVPMESVNSLASYEGQNALVPKLLPVRVKQPPTMRTRSRDEDEPIPAIRYPPSWGQNQPLSSLGASRKLSDESDDSFHSAESHHKSDYNVLTSIDRPKTNIMYEESLSEGMENNINIKTVNNKEDDGTGKGLCQICYVNQINCIFLPCGHARTCEECATRIKNSGQPCPYCRKEVTTTHRIFYKVFFMLYVCCSVIL